MSNLRKTYYLETLGCAKNEVDSEALEIDLLSAGFERTEDVASADLILVNSCGFINDAKIESIDAALNLHRVRKSDSLLVMCGCLPARYGMQGILKEVDLFLPSDQHGQLISHLAGKGWSADRRNISFKRLSPSAPYAYLKISEGCNNRCSYCAIPEIKGPYRSRDHDEIVSEAEFLCRNSVKELVLVGQDTTMYGVDKTRKTELVGLVKRLSEIENLEWLRLMYAHPAHLSDDIINMMVSHDKLLKYIDLPLQHCSDSILMKMNRKTDKGKITELIARLRGAVPGIVLRTTFIVGFPGETDNEFKELLDFCEETRFDNVGLFKFSPEDGTPAYSLGGRVNQEVVEERFLTLLDLQNKISKAKLESRVGKTERVLIQRVENEGIAVGRARFQAPEVDGLTFVESPRAQIGSMMDVRITGAGDYDLQSTPLEMR